MEMSLVGLLMMVITMLSSVNGQSRFEIGLCLVSGVNDILRVDPFCGFQLRTLINSQEFYNLPESTLNEVCSTSCWNRFSPVVRRCFNADADNAELGYRLACGRQPDGDNCAQVFNSLRDDMTNNEGVCRITTRGQCPAGCTNHLMVLMQQLGCCFGESLYLFSMLDSTRQLYVNLMEAYRTCNLPLPQPCQNINTEATAPPTRITIPTIRTITIPTFRTITIPTLRTITIPTSITTPTRNNSGATGGWAFNGIMMTVMLMMSLMV